MSPLALTIATDVVLPFEDVELSLRTKDGSPVVVRCEFIDELRSAEIMRRWAGDVPPTADMNEMSDEESVALIAQRGRPLIEAGTMLLGPNGEEVRPAFYFGDGPRHPLSLPGRYLKMADLVLLSLTLFRLTGYAGGVPEASFPDGERGRATDGVGTGPDGEEVRTDPE
jgi:hypothetical protein